MDFRFELSHMSPSLFCLLIQEPIKICCLGSSPLNSFCGLNGKTCKLFDFSINLRLIAMKVSSSSFPPHWLLFFNTDFSPTLIYYIVMPRKHNNKCSKCKLDTRCGVFLLSNFFFVASGTQQITILFRPHLI